MSAIEPRASTIRSTKRAFSLIEIMVVLVLLVLLAAFLMPKYLRGSKTASGKRVEAPIQRAQSVDCGNNLRQIRGAVQMATTADEENKPQSLAALRTYGVSEAMTVCPVSRQPYQFAPANGQVSCVHSTHAGL